MMRRLSRFLLLVVWVIGSAVPHPVVSAASRSAPEGAPPRLQATGADITWNPATGVPDFITFPREAPVDGGVPSLSAAVSPEAAALDFFTAYAPAYQMADPSSELAVERVTTDDLGYTHVRLAQQAGGVPVFGAVLIVHFAPNGAITAVNGRYSPGVPAPGRPALDPRAALEAARGALRLKRPSVDESELLVFNPALVDAAYENRPRLAYRLRLVEAAGGAPWVAFVDAQDGRLLFHYRDRAEAKAIEVYEITYSTRTPCSSTSSEPPDDCTLAFNHTGAVYDYYYETFGRDSFDGAGATMIANIVLYDGGNAYWDGSATSFGPGMATLDIVAHEWTHAVSEYTAGLEYVGESGALDESFADIFGAMVDRDDWVMGEGSAIGEIRDLTDPTRFGQPDRFSNYWYNGEVHYNDGIPNKGAYLMSEGGTFNDYDITGIGRANTERIYYRVLSQYLGPTSTFRDAYTATVLACADLFGASSTCASAQAALQAVEMDDPYALIRPHDPAPMNGFKRVVVGTEYLSWMTQDLGDETIWYYDVAFGSAPENLAPLSSCTKIEQQRCPMPAGLLAGATYYWQVRVYNEGESENISRTGKVWSFTVSDGSAVTLPFSDNFSGRTLADGWNIKTTGVGKVQFGSYGELVMTREPEAIDSSVELSLIVDVPADDPLTLQFTWAGTNDSADEAPYGLVLWDGVKESVVIPIHRKSPNVGSPVETVDLKQAATNAGLNTSGKLYIIFRILFNDTDATGDLFGDLLQLYQVTLSKEMTVPAFNCETVTAVPKAECQALSDFYNATKGDNGEAWNYRGSWLRNNNLCEWFGVTCTSGHVTGLALNDNNLVSTSPVSLSALSALKSLRLEDNQIGAFPVLPGGITYLDLSNNHISGAIPDTLLELADLEELYLNDNALEGAIPPGLGQLPLNSLDLSDNLLEGSIPAGLFTETIQFLWLGSNKLSGPIPAEVLNAEALLTLDLEFNRLTADPANTALLDWLNEKSWGWDWTQTIAPTGVTAIVVPGAMEQVLFTPIRYQSGGGGYEAACATSESGDYAPCGSVTDKTLGSLPLQGLQPGATYFVKVRSFTPAGWYNKSDLWSDYSAPVAATALDSLPIETRDNFEGSALGKGWLRLVNGWGRVRLSNELARVGSNSLVLDCTTGSGPSLSAAVVTFDLDGVEDAVLSFYWADFDPVEHPEDGVFISDDYGVTWTRVLSLDSGANDYRRAHIDLVAAAAEHGLTLNDHFQVKFQFYDEGAWGLDAGFFQQVDLTGYSIDGLELSRYGWISYLPVISK